MPASTRRVASPLLFKFDPFWLPPDYQGNLRALSGNRIVTATFDRGGTVGSASSVDANGKVFIPGYKTPRWYHSYDSTTGTWLPRGILLEGSRANPVVQSDALATTWTAANCTPTNAVGTYAGMSFSRVTGIGATSTLYQSVTMTGDATKSWYFYVKTNGVAGDLSVIWYDATAPATRRSLLITVSATGVVTSSAGTVTALPDGVYKVEVTVASVVAANDNRIYMVNNSASNTLASILLTGIQPENATFGSTRIPTTTGAVTRAADTCKFAAADVPQAQTGYVKLVSGQPSNFDGSIVWQRGSNAGARLVLSRTSGAATYTLLHNNGSASVSATVNATTAVGDIHELRPILNTDGSVQLGISINSAAEVVGSASAANALTTAWGDAFFYLNNDSTDANQGFAAYNRVLRASGVQTMAYLRAA